MIILPPGLNIDRPDDMPFIELVKRLYAENLELHNDGRGNLVARLIEEKAA